MTPDDILIRALDSGVAIIAVVAFYKVCIKLIEANGRK